MRLYLYVTELIAQLIDEEAPTDIVGSAPLIAVLCTHHQRALSTWKKDSCDCTVHHESPSCAS